jgi:hypothetical protein
MKKNGPSHTVGHESSKQQGRYSLERNHCVCADAKCVSANDKKKPMSLDTFDVVRDVEKLDISEIRDNLGDRKCLTEQRKSFVEHPDAF